VTAGGQPVLSSLHPRHLGAVLGLAALLLAGAALAPSTIAAPADDGPTTSSVAHRGSSPGSGASGGSWSQLLARVVPEPARRPPPRARFSQTSVVALYGFPGVPVMGALGEGSPEEMAARVEALAKDHQRAAHGTKVVGALHLIVGVAEVAPGSDGTYLDRLDHAVIERDLAATRERDLLLFLDVQIGWADPLTEVQKLERFLKDPDVQLALDPEFATKGYNAVPGKVIGTLNADDVNRVQHYLAELVRKEGIPPKMLVLHQFMDSMLADTQSYEPLPEVEITVDMDGYGSAGAKLDHYEEFALAPYAERPAIKLFYRWDVPVMTAEELYSLATPPGLVVYQ
jgi:hypothetical protein